MSLSIRRPSGRSISIGSMQPSLGATNTHSDAANKYVEAILRFADRKPEDWLHSGYHYKAFANKLRELKAATTVGNFSFATIIEVHRDDTPQQAKPSRTDGTSGRQSRSPSPMASPAGAAAETRRYTKLLFKPSDLYVSPPISDRHSQVLFLRGYPSKDWISTIGSKYNIDSEFWRRHRLPLWETAPLYDLPTLPSFGQGIFQLRVFSLILMPNNKMSREDLLQLRVSEGDNNLKEFRKDTVRGALVGASLVRGLQAVTKKRLVVEQWISCTLATDNDGWAAVVWSDVGQSLPASLIKGQAGVSAGAGLDHIDAQFIPVIQPTANAALAEPFLTTTVSAPTGAETWAQAQHIERNKQSTAYLPTEQYGATLDPARMYASPLYAISDVFRHCACSSNQWVNMMDDNIRFIMRVEDPHANSKSEAEALEDLQYAKHLVDDHAMYVGDVVAHLESGCKAWVRPWQHRPRPPPPSSGGPSSHKDGQNQPENEANEGEADTAVTDADLVLDELLHDFRYLLNRLKKLSAHCRESAELLLSRAQLRESQAAISKADEMGTLTLLVFVFAPLSFMSSIFGMNFVTPKAKVGIPIYVALTCVLAMAMILLAQKPVRGRIRKQWKKLVD